MVTRDLDNETQITHSALVAVVMIVAVNVAVFVQPVHAHLRLIPTQRIFRKVRSSSIFFVRFIGLAYNLTFLVQKVPENDRICDLFQFGGDVVPGRRRALILLGIVRGGEFEHRLRGECACFI
jgi:hypothetical protein